MKSWCTNWFTSTIEKAMQDISYVADARRYVNYLEPFLPTKEDVFMHSAKMPGKECYSWIGAVEFGDLYSKALSARLGK